MANGILPYLDYDVIANSEKMFLGYSDLTTIINAIYAKMGKASVLYQIRNLIYDDKEQQIGAFDKVAGILLGTFTEMEQENCQPMVEVLLKRIVLRRNVKL